MTYQSAQAIHEFRQQTAKHDKSPMNGVSTFYTFKCPECNQIKPTKSRKSRGHKAGFRCLDCHTEKSAAKSADEKNPASSVR